MGGGEVEAVLIAGPTASGKSALAVRLARDFGGVVINADSMQVYRDLRILTARPTEADTALAPHRLFGEIDGGEVFSAGRYAAAAGLVLDDARAAGSLPILVGGTGLYIKALIDGLSDIPAVPDGVRQQVRARAEGRAASDLHAELARSDPASATRLRPSDRQRILRALEVVTATGRSLTSFHDARRPGPLSGRRLLRLFLSPDRSELRARIDSRFRQMVASGAVEEVEALGRRELDPSLPVMRAHGVPGLLAHLRGDIALEEAIARGQADTRAYAKRQVTWFRHQMPDFAAAGPREAYRIAAAALGRPSTGL